MSVDTIIKVAGIVPANDTTNDISAIDIPEDGEILAIGGVILGLYSKVPGASQNLTLQLSSELSFLSTNQIGSNDSRGSIAGIGVACVFNYAEAGETGGGGGNLSEFGVITFPEGIIVNAGERIHLHGFSNSADLTAAATYVLYLKTKGGARRAGRRR